MTNLLTPPSTVLLYAGLGVLAMSGVLAACGSGSPAAPAQSGASAAAAAASSSAAAAAAPAVPAPSPLTCSTATTDNSLTAAQVIGVLITDQKSQDASEEQNWVDLVDGTPTSQGNDLAAAATVLGSYSSTQLAADGSEFATDAQAFLSNESGGLMPGWVSGYRLVQHDIASLAADCGASYTVPAGE